MAISSKAQPKKSKFKVEITPADASRLSYVAGQRGNPKLVIDGYSFVRNKGNQSQVYYRCANRRRHKCLAKVVTDSDGTRCTLTYPYHNHKPDICDDNKDD